MKLIEPFYSVCNAIACSKQEFFPPGQCIIQQGDKGDKFYIISGGNVKITKKEPGVLLFMWIIFHKIKFCSKNSRVGKGNS
jgi:CRP-like cAMP-binding protein